MQTTCTYLYVIEVIYLFINYNTITNYILIIYELSSFDHLLGVLSQTRVSGGNRTHDPDTRLLGHSSKIRINIHITNRIRTQFRKCVTITMALVSVNKLESNIPKSNSLFLETYCCVVWNTDNSRASKMRSYSERAKINWRIFTHVIFLLKVSKVQAFSKRASPSI